MSRRPAPASTNQLISILIADSTRMGCQLLAHGLRHCCRGLDVCASVTGPQELFAALRDCAPQLAIVSANLGDGPLSGINVTRKLRTSHPEIKVVILLDSSRRDLIVEAFRAGAKGVFCRSDSVKALSSCVCSVASGQVWANSTQLGFVLDALTEESPFSLVDTKGGALLSKREEDVVRCVAEGLTNREIATQLKLSEHTVKNYLFRIFDKLGVSSRVETVLYALSKRASAQASSPIPDQRLAPHHDDVATFQWYQQAAKQGYGIAQYIVGLMYRDGLGVQQDNISAYMWLRLAERRIDSIGKKIKEAKDRLKPSMKSDDLAEAHHQLANWLGERAVSERRLFPKYPGVERRALPTAGPVPIPVKKGMAYSPESHGKKNLTSTDGRSGTEEMRHKENHH